MSRRFQPDAPYWVFLDLLVETRTDQSVTQEELAARLELSPAQVAAFESGKRQLHFVQTRQWCQALGVSFLEFMIELDATLATEELLNTPDVDAPEADTDAEPEGGAR